MSNIFYLPYSLTKLCCETEASEKTRVRPGEEKIGNNSTAKGQSGVGQVGDNVNTNALYESSKQVISGGFRIGILNHFH
jgi:hypothetical protein